MSSSLTQRDLNEVMIELFGEISANETDEDMSNEMMIDFIIEPMCQQ